MTIKSKIILITVPLIITPLIITLFVAVLSSRNGITNVATDFLKFKSKVMVDFVENQWTLLENNNLHMDSEYLEISKKTVEEYSGTLVENENETIFAFNSNNQLTMNYSQITVSESDLSLLQIKMLKNTGDWQEFALNGTEYISNISYFEPFDWYIVIAVKRSSFYGIITQMTFQTLVIFLISMGLSVYLLIFFSNYLTKPVEKIVDAIRTIISTNDLTIKVKLQYNDEIGELGHFFNIMINQLEIANQQIKNYALKSVISKRKEMKIRNIFQKYVPRNVIEKFFSEPDSMLEGENRVLAILFSDIRSFTTFSEKLPPYEVVDSLNKYFEYMVDVITSHGGIVDKYIGDAIMAFFGAPVHHTNDSLQSVLSGLEMIEKLKDFNLWQGKYNREEFKIGIGINYGIVTVGNIGSEKKMDYTVIGDMVNVASRLEGLTKLYKEPILISEPIYQEISEDLPCRLIDRVVVKGKTESVNIYSVRKVLTPVEEKAWEYHSSGIDLYYRRDFIGAQILFRKVNDLIPDDYTSSMFFNRCGDYIKNPPPEKWTGDTVLNRK